MSPSAFHFTFLIFQRLEFLAEKLLCVQVSVERAVQRVADDFNLTYSLFADHALPSLPDTVRLFSEAVAVVGPHGAGLSNTYFSSDGVVVVEAVCSPPHVRLCYQFVSRRLGHRWHGVASRGRSQKALSVTAAEIVRPLRQLLAATVERRRGRPGGR